MAHKANNNGVVKQMQDVTSDGFTSTGDRVQLIDEDNPEAERELSSPGSERSEISPLQLEEADSMNSKKKTQEGLRIIVISSISFAVIVTVALVVTILVGPPAVLPHGAVSCDSQQCSDIGAELLKKGGSAVDAAIGTLMCLGVVNPQHSGIGGGLFMLIRQHKTNTSTAIDARETAPAAADENLYSDPALIKLGNLAVAVPGSLRGLEAAHTKYGSLSWQDVISPAAKLARDGFKVEKNLAFAIETAIDPQSDLDEGLKGLFYLNGNPAKEGDKLYNQQLASVLEDVAQEGVRVFYEGKYAQEIVNATEDAITLLDLKGYAISEVETLKKPFRNMTIETMPAPGGGPLVMFILHVLQNYTLSPDNETDPLFYHRLIEAMKFMVGEKQKFGDPAFVMTVDNATEEVTSMDYAAEIRGLIDDTRTFHTAYYLSGTGVKLESGAAQVSVIGSQEDMVSITSSINGLFGSHIVTPSGIILNNQMASFDLPRDNISSENNKIEPGKRPLSSMTPTVVHRTGKPCAPRIALGGVNGSQIISGVAEVLINLLVFDKNITSAIEAKRISNILDPNVVLYDDGFPQSILNELSSLGHSEMALNTVGINYIHGVAKINETVMAHGDKREAGSGATIF